MTITNQIELDVRSLITQDFKDFFTGQRILITGASGLMGSYFTALFQEFNLNFGGKSQLYLVSKSDRYPISIHASTSRLKMDLSEEINLDYLPKFDLIIHCAGYAQPSLFQKSPLETISVNSSSVLSLMKRVDQRGSFLFFSSSEVYSGLISTPHKEIDIGNTNTNHPRSAYIESKRLGEAIICNANYHFPELRSFAARLSLSYGPGFKSDDTRVINQFITKAITKGCIDLMDSGSALRTYCYVADAVEMCIGILMFGNEKIYNVGGESRTSVLGLANLIAEKTGASVVIPQTADGGQAGSPIDVRLDLYRIKSLIGKNHFMSLDEGIQRTINWYNLNC